MKRVVTTAVLVAAFSPLCLADTSTERSAENLEAIQGTDRWQSGYAPGRWQPAPPPAGEDRYPPQLWYTPPHYDRSTNPYPPGRWEYPPPPGPYWNAPPTSQRWQPAPPRPLWQPGYPPHHWRW